MRGRAYDRPFIDIGVPQDLARAHAFVAAVLTRPAVVFTRAALIRAISAEQIVWCDGAAEAIKAVNDAGLFAFLQNDGQKSAALRQAGFAPALVAAGAHLDAVFEGPPPWPAGPLRIAAVRTIDKCSESGAATESLFARAGVAIEQLADASGGR